MASSLSIIPNDAPMPNGSNVISILSYNILLPNSIDGWWLYKMYSPKQVISEQETSWNHRVQLLENQIRSANADIVCLQECSPESFQTDFEFMTKLGYTESELYKKGRFRPATFWRPDRVYVSGEISHRDRCLVIPFKQTETITIKTENDMKPEDLITDVNNGHSEISNGDGGGGGGNRSVVVDLNDCAKKPTAYVVNVHLSAGPEGGRRLRQIWDVCDYLRKNMKSSLSNNNKVSNSKKQKKKGVVEVIEEVKDTIDTIVIVGDMNAEANQMSGVSCLLQNGECLPDFLEDGVVITNKAKKQALGEFVDPYEFAYRSSGQLPPYTMVAESLVPRLVALGEEEHGRPHPVFIHSLHKTFQKFASGTGGIIIEKMPLFVRELVGKQEFEEIVLPLRHRVLWPNGSLDEAKVVGEDDFLPEDEQTVVVQTAEEITANNDDEKGKHNLNNKNNSIFSPIHLGLYEGFKDSLVGVVSLYNDQKTMNNQSDQHVQQVQLRKFAIEEWCQGKGMGSLLLEHAKTIALKRCQNLAANKEKKNYDEGGDDGNDNLSLSGTKHKYILWLDARVHQVPFYENRGFIMVGEPFEKYGKLYARMEHILIQNNNQEEVQVDSINNNHIDHIERNDSNTNVTQSPLTRRLPYENSSFVDKEILNDQVYQVIGSIDVMCMGVESIRQWLLTINKQVGRGSEFRKALELIRGAKVNNASSSDERALPEEGCLTWEDFKTIYIEEMNQGKFWGVAWDMNECGFPLADLESPSSSSNQSLSSSSSSTTQSANSNNRFLARYDRAFVRSGKIRAVRETLAAGITEYPLLPNAHHPSDHLPIALSVELC